MQRTIQLEFNELSPVLLDDFIAAGELPNFRALRDRSEVFVTDASSEITLEPWVQWATLHTGIPDSDHGIRNLGEADLVSGKGIGRELAAAGYPVGIFGSMNVDYGPLNGFTVPDPWNPHARVHPADIEPIFSFVAEAVQESSGNGLPLRDAPRFVACLVSHGLRPSTAWGVVRQLVDERREPGLSWRRACVLDAMSFDVFTHLVQRHDVAFATFFANSTAHFMHYYWRNFRPDEFSVPPADEDHESLDGAVLEGYRRMDALLGLATQRFPDSRIVFATALSQQPWDTTKCVYRPLDMDEVVRLAGLDPTAVRPEPVMAEEFCLTFGSTDALDDGLARLSQLELGGAPLLRTVVDGLRVKVGCDVNDWDVGDQQVLGSPGGPRGFDELFTRIHGLRSGRHHADGCLWISADRQHVHSEKVPLTAVAPTILDLFSVPQPTYMKEAPLDLVGRASTS